MIPRRLFFAVLATFTASSTAFGEDFYGAYGLYPQGSTRVMAMGGAFVALSDDIAGSIYNSAGLAMTDRWGDIGGNSSNVSNFEADLDNDGHPDGIPYAYANYAAVYHPGKWVFGIGINLPYFVDLEFAATNPNDNTKTDIRRVTLSLTNLDIPIGYRINDQWAVGVVHHQETLAERYQKRSSDPSTAQFDLQMEGKAATTSFGVIYRPAAIWGLGFSHTPGRRYSVDSGLNSMGDGLNWFKSVKIPAKTIFGGFWRFHPEWTAVMDLDYFEPVSDAVFVGSEFFTGFNRVEVDPSAKSVLHGGVEWHPIDKGLWDLYLRMGYYSEPPRLKNGSARQHSTFGFEVRFWALTLSLAADTARDPDGRKALVGPAGDKKEADVFTNVTAGIGLSLKPF